MNLYLQPSKACLFIILFINAKLLNRRNRRRRLVSYCMGRWRLLSREFRPWPPRISGGLVLPNPPPTPVHSLFTAADPSRPTSTMVNARCCPRKRSFCRSRVERKGERRLEDSNIKGNVSGLSNWLYPGIAGATSQPLPSVGSRVHSVALWLAIPQRFVMRGDRANDLLRHLSLDSAAFGPPWRHLTHFPHLQIVCIFPVLKCKSFPAFCLLQFGHGGRRKRCGKHAQAAT